MAEGLSFTCDECGHSIDAWSDGNPYYIDKTGVKQYAYHPDHERLARCIGNDSPHLCLKCGHEFMIDSRAPITACPNCDASDIADTYHLAGHQCPYCKVGVFTIDPSFHAIS
jgi:DNA-directed RNA polymerase subunit RPC12/RpoP